MSPLKTFRTPVFHVNSFYSQPLEKARKQPMFELNGTSILVFGSFAVYMTVMNKLFFTPMFNVIQSRQALIEGAIATAQAAAEQNAKTTQECEEKIRATRDTAQKNIQVVVDAAREKASGIKAEARQEALTQIESKTQELDQAAIQCYDSLQNQKEDFVRLIAEKVSSRVTSLVS